METKPTTIQESPSQKIERYLDERTDKFQKALGGIMPVEKFISIVRSSITKNPKLLNCTPSSLLNCAMDCAQLGLAPDNALGRAYLIPFHNRKDNTDICTLVIGYKGLVELAYRTGKVASIDAEVVYEGDHFKHQFGTRAFLDHIPNLDRDKNAQKKSVYCVIRLKDGGASFRVMSIHDIDDIRKRSKNKDSEVWVKDWDEMAKKTVFRRLAKMIQLSTDFMEALSKDQEAEFDFDPNTPTATSVITGTSKPDISSVQVQATDAESVDMQPVKADDVPRHENGEPLFP